MASFGDKVKVVLGSVPFWGAAAVGVLTAVAAELVPVLPGPVAVKVGAYIASALAAISAVVKTVARVTPVLFPEDVGLVVDESPESTDFFSTDEDV
jgi:hypothetical protein